MSASASAHATSVFFEDSQTTHRAPRMSRLQAKPPVMAPIIIYLQKNTRADDILYIHRFNNGLFRATFKNRTVGREHMTEFDNFNNMIEYLDTFIMMTMVDRDGYDFIQVNVPGLPAVLIRPSRSDWNFIFHRVRSYLSNTTETQNNWPKEYSEYLVL